ncbi:hypothetical protein [Rhizobium ruizarguesonis]|nr:hypothetical protein [Rhizobium ruizarguesonis]TAY75186.1 hypothetical protein ELH84_15590 [Rhizobium ruizarguesonis]
MQFDYRAASRFMFRMFLRFAWRTSQRRWTTVGVAVALFLTTAFIPNLGIAVFGTAFAGWWIVLGVMALLGGLAGNRVGIGREKATLIRQSEPSRD